MVYLVNSIATNDRNIANVIICMGFFVISCILSDGYNILVLAKPIIINSTVNDIKNANILFIEENIAHINGSILNTTRIIVVFDGFSMIFIPPT